MNSPSETYRFLLVLQAVDKITQMQGKSGNELIINRRKCLYRGEDVAVPVLSANGLRHVAVREPNGLWLMERYGIVGAMNKETLRLLVGGGNNASIKGGAENLRQAAEMKAAWPLLGLMGCGLPHGPQAGKLKFSDAVLLCNETRDYMEVITRGVVELPEQLRPARTCVCGWTNYRHDPVEQSAEYLIDAAEESPHSGMIFSGEAIIPGSILISEIHAEGPTPVELGALLWSLRLWQHAGGFVGGMSARGNGRTTAMLYCDHADVDQDGLVSAYIEYAGQQKDRALRWLVDVFGEKRPAAVKPEKPAAKRGKGKPSAEPVEAAPAVLTGDLFRDGEPTP